MTQRIIQAAAQVARIGHEVTFGVTPANMIPIFLSGDALPLGESATEMLAVTDTTVYQHAGRRSARGLQRRGPVKFSVDGKRLRTRLTAAALAPVAVTNAAALSHQILLHHAFGGHHSDRGSTVVSATVNAVTIDAGHGARFAPGQVAIVGVAGVLCPRVVQSVAGDVVTVRPDLPGAPAAGQLVLNTYSFYRAEDHSHTIALETAHREGWTPESQKRGRGIRGQIAWTAEIGQLVKMAFDGVSQAHDGPGDLGLTVADALDDMGASMPWGTAAQSFLFASDVTASPVHVCMSKLQIGVPNAWTEIPCTAGVEGAGGAVMIGGRSGPVTVEATVQHDAAWTAGFLADASYSLLSYTAPDAGAAQRFMGWSMGNLAIDAEPTSVNEGGLVYTKLKFRALANEAVAGSPLAGASTDLMRSPVVFFLG